MKSNVDQKLLNVVSDLRRVSLWLCDDHNKRKDLVMRFLDNITTDIKNYDTEIKNIIVPNLPQKFHWNNQQWKRKCAENLLTASLRLQHRLGL